MAVTRSPRPVPRAVPPVRKNGTSAPTRAAIEARVGSDGETQIVNSRIHQNILIVDRLFGAAELRLGSGDRQQTVRIVRIEQRQAVQPANATGESPS